MDFMSSPVSNDMFETKKRNFDDVEDGELDELSIDFPSKIENTPPKFSTYTVNLPHGADAYIRHDGRVSFVQYCSPEVYVHVLNRNLPHNVPRLYRRPSNIIFNGEVQKYMNKLFNTFAEDMWGAILTAAKSGKRSQGYNIGNKMNGKGYDVFKAPKHLQLGVPWQVLELFLEELKKNDPCCAFPFFDGRLFGIDTKIMRNRSFTVVFGW